MASFDPSCYEQCLCALLDGDAATRTRGEQFLAAAEQTRLSELLAALCAVLERAAAAPSVRQLACIVLKNLVKAHWDAASKRYAPPLIALDARAPVRRAVLHALGAADSKLRTAAATTLCEILCWDWPAAWPTAVADLVRCTQDSSPRLVRGALAALDQFLATADIPDVSTATRTRSGVCRCTGRMLMHLPSSGSRKSAISPFITSGRIATATP